MVEVGTGWVLCYLVFAGEVPTHLAVAEHRKPALSSTLRLTPRKSLELHCNFFAIKHEVLLLDVLVIILEVLTLHLDHLAIDVLLPRHLYIPQRNPMRPIGII